MTNFGCTCYFRFILVKSLLNRALNQAVKGEKKFWGNAVFHFLIFDHIPQLRDQLSKQRHRYVSFSNKSISTCFLPGIFFKGGGNLLSCKFRLLCPIFYYLWTKFFGEVKERKNCFRGAPPRPLVEEI